MNPRIALPVAFLRTLWLSRRLRTQADVRAHQARQVRRLIAHAAAHTAFYEEFAGRDLDDLPIVDKSLQLERFAAFNTQGLEASEAWRIVAGETSYPGFEVGCSTGTMGPRGLYIISATERFRWLGVIVAKVLPDVLLTRHRVAVVLPGPSPLYQSANESRVLRLAHFDPRSGLERLVGAIEAFDPTVLLGAPKTLRGLANAGAKIRPRKLFAAGEVLDAVDTALIQRAFAAPVGQIYMATEGLLGTSCTHGHLHLAEDIATFEWLPVAGDLTLVSPLFTDFTRRTQIMARYRLGDLLRCDDGLCPCGSPLRRARVVGRAADLVIVPSHIGEPVALAPDRLGAIVTGSAPGIDDYRIGLGEHAQGLRLLLPQRIGRDGAEAARAALATYVRGLGAEIAVVAELADLTAPFDRKLRRIAPVPPESL